MDSATPDLPAATEPVEPTANAVRQRALDRFVVTIATGFGAGRSPVAPGTLGSLLGIPLAWLIALTPGLQLGETPIFSAEAVQVALLAFLLLSGGFICGHAAAVLQQKDPKSVVYDEYATVAGVFLLLPWDRLTCPGVLTVGFLLHRLFDISKPWPIRELEKLPGGWGIMTDDIAAGVLAGAILRGLIAAGLFDGWSAYF